MIRAIWRAMRRALLRYQIWETEHYIADCEANGISAGMMMSEFRGQLCAMRVELALLTPAAQARLAHGPAEAPAPAEACTDIGADMAASHWSAELMAGPGALHAAAAVVLVVAAAAVVVAA